VIVEYGGTLTLPPSVEDFLDFDVFLLENVDERLIQFFLLIDNKRSDLAARVIVRNDSGKYSYYLYDMLVP
jgi:hypothetical protein